MAVTAPPPVAPPPVETLPPVAPPGTVIDWSQAVVAGTTESSTPA